MPNIDGKAHAAIPLLACFLTCLTLSACGSSSHSAPAKTSAVAATSRAPAAPTTPSDPTKASPPASKQAGPTPSTQAPHESQHQVLVEFTACARHHGFHVRGPNASNNIDTRGINLNSKRYKATVYACLHKIEAKKARAGEDPTAP